MTEAVGAAEPRFTSVPAKAGKPEPADLLLDIVVGLFVAVSVSSAAPLGLGSSFDPSRIEVLATQGLSIAALLALWVHSPTNVLAIRGTVAWLMAIPVVGLILMPFSSNPLNTALGAVPHIALVAAVAILVRHRGAERAVAVVASAVFLLLGASILVEVFGPTTSGELFDDDRGLLGFSKFRGLLAEPNAAGRLSAVGVVLAVSLLRRQPRLPWWWIGLIVSAGCLFASQSRASWVAAILAVGTLIALRYGPRVVIAALAVTAFAVFGLGRFNLDETRTLVERDENQNELVSLTGRTSAWRSSIPYVIERPLVGWGFNAASVPLDDAWRRGDVSFPAGHAHNGLLNLALTQGAIGVAILLGGLVTAVIGYRRRPHRLAVGLLVLVATNLIAESIFVGDPDPLTLGLIIAAVLTSVPLATETSGERVA